MNAHNEQHDPASAVVKQNLTTQPAAAQEAVAYWRVTFRMYPENIDCCETFVRGPDRPTLDTLGISPRPVQIISTEPLYAAPVTAAPGIDLEQFRALACFGEEFAFSAERQPQSRVVYSQAKRLHALIDASPKGDDVQDGRFPNGLTDAIAYANAMEEAAGALYAQVFGHETDGSDTGTDLLEEVLRELRDSPRGGSEAVERIAALLYEEATDEPWTVAGVEHDGPDRAYYRELASRVLDAAQAGDAEVQP